VRSMLGLAASAVAGLAAIIANQDGDGDIVPFFVGLTLIGGVEAWAAHPPFIGRRRRLAQGVALLWLLAAVWTAVLLLAFAQASGPPPQPEDTYLGLTATVYHVVGLFGGAVLVLISAFGPAPPAGGLAHSAIAPSADPGIRR